MSKRLKGNGHLHLSYALEVKSDQPGNCSTSGMKLEKKEAIGIESNGSNGNSTPSCCSESKEASCSTENKAA